jgi:ribulose-5-phosphate 4-epimerase/fuculose-1-phosphate aldolase
MPLSEEERRILQEMERHLYEQDAPFVERVSSENVYTFGLRKAAAAAVVVLIGLGTVVWGLTASLAVSLVGFAVTLAGIAWLARLLGRVLSTAFEEIVEKAGRGGEAAGSGWLLTSIRRLIGHK